MSFEWKIAKRFLFSQKRNGSLSFLTIISLLGVTIGVAALLIVLSIMNGFTTDLQKNLIDTHSHIVIQKKDHKPFTKSLDLEKKIKSILEVSGVSAFIKEEMIIQTSVGTLGTELKAIDPITIDQVSHFSKGLKPVSKSDNQKPKLSELSTTQNPPRIILGRALASRLRTYENEEVKIISPFTTMGPLGSIAKTKIFSVLGTSHTGVFDVDASYSYVALSEGQKFLENKNHSHGYEVRTLDPWNVQEVTHKIKETLDPQFEVLSWKKMHENLFFAFRLEKIAMFSILCFVILIASFSIIATLFMMVADKSRQVSILRALGATGSSIQKTFNYQGLTIGLAGTTLGLLLGTIVCLLIKYSSILKLPDIYYQTQVPVEMKPLYFILISFTALLISVSASYLPARQASKITPLEGINYVKR